MKHGAAGSCREQALSEVIGFVLIIGIIMVAFSLYMVYGVPVQGRENEINHMSAINDQFVSYKIGIDSLVTNQQKGLAMSTTFPLGTAGQTAQGSTSIIPVLQPSRVERSTCNQPANNNTGNFHRFVQLLYHQHDCDNISWPNTDSHNADLFKCSIEPVDKYLNYKCILELPNSRECPDHRKWLEHHCQCYPGYCRLPEQYKYRRLRKFVIYTRLFWIRYYGHRGEKWRYNPEPGCGLFQY